MEKYYSSYYLKQQKQISKEQFIKQGFAYKDSIVENILYKVIERLDKDGSVLRVYYYSDNLTTEIKTYHTNNYSKLSLMICKDINNGLFINYYNNNFEFTGITIETYHENGQLNLWQEFNKNFELVEYRQCIYNEQNRRSIEKIFFANSWVIHEEEL